MPKRTDIATVMIIGAGPIVIGQACEFDYSGTQACKALREEGYRIVLVNSNPATIMTDPDMADRTYVEPITPEIVARIIAAERHAVPGGFALLPTMGGQTALNCALSLNKMGVLAEHDVELIGATAHAIDKAEDRELFRDAMTKIGLDTPRSHHVNSLAKALAALDDIGLPAIIRPSFTLGGTGGGIAYNREEYIEIVEGGLDASPTSQVLVEESVLGWKEFEMEVVRDKADNCIIVCSIENIDPMGVHTGDSITVAPALTLTDKEYQIIRDASLAVLREIGVETGGSNVQFAINPANGRMIVIEMNPRVSRSSALASKATGFPIAKVAAKLAVGYTLDEVANDITGGATPASFEPTIDYVVTKIPRFAFEKFPGAEPILTTAMKSVGEAMAIGRTFAESLQKALRSLETGLSGLDEIAIDGLGQGDDPAVLRAALGKPTPDRLLNVAQALRHGMSHADIYEACRIDHWFIERLQEIVDLEAKVRRFGLPKTPGALRGLKAAGFSDARLAALADTTPDTVATLRKSLDVRPVFKRIDTCAAEFASPTAYMYSTYAAPFAGVLADEARPSDRTKIVILGGGPNRIGQGIEFDYCCCHACFALSEAGYETIMVNCNPETVSTDYDTSDRLYFEPLTAEDVLAILDKEREAGTLKGVIVQFGGQTPLKLAKALEKAGIPILGTSVDSIDLAEDRDRFKRLLDRLDLKQPENGIAYSVEQSRTIAGKLGLPLVVRPSYVLGGRAMAVIRDQAGLDDYLLGTLPGLVPADVKARYPNDKTGQINTVLGENPLLFDRYLSNATEVDVDCLCDGTDVFIAGIMEHIEEAGIHSGDSACSLPPRSLSADTIASLEEQTRRMALALHVGGLMNVQYAIKDGQIFVLEVNPRASRTVPFVAKVIGVPLAKIASRIMAGEPLASFGLRQRTLDHVGVKESVFPFARFPNVDTVLGPEMRSTGEVIGLARSFEVAFAKSQLGGGTKVPKEGTVFVSVRDVDKPRILPTMKALSALGFKIQATGGTFKALQAEGVSVSKINKVSEGRPHIVDAIKNGSIDLVFNTTESALALSDSRSLRQAALMHKVPYYTTIAGAIAAAQGIGAQKSGDLEVRALQDYFD
ncbi:carbamoyl-phosphate synthase large subunit [Lichenihabitans sp. Uapishka_5]|uniref:carbamoyl-phosphate synthase large subunit n=1 Tax=Lichenihabitans sp. Uapishka_5 TaxID=3037302 RepID=UPI0029E82124|nr:carbamoyl-phosphate synthase large subunit [Lichenihabitans sp. Uapishka_5]MDX7951957.1 carbamoyl-phosphate synthase large subunit [Lichenihabitans sp. Uapishka_5]